MRILVDADACPVKNEILKVKNKKGPQKYGPFLKYFQIMVLTDRDC